LSLSHKFCMDNPLTVKKADEHGFYFWLAHSRFFGRGDADVCHSLIYLFVSGLYSKIHVSSPVITFSKKFLSLCIRSRWRHTSFRLSFSLIVRFLGTIFVHNFLMANSCVKISWTVVWFKLNSLVIIRNVSWKFDRTRARTFSTLLSIFEVEGLPEWGSSLMDSRPSENALYHLNLFQCRFPQVWHKTWLHIFARNCALPFPWHTHT